MSYLHNKNYLHNRSNMSNMSNMSNKEQQGATRSYLHNRSSRSYKTLKQKSCKKLGNRTFVPTCYFVTIIHRFFTNSIFVNAIMLVANNKVLKAKFSLAYKDYMRLTITQKTSHSDHGTTDKEHETQDRNTGQKTRNTREEQSLQQKTLVSN